MSDWTIERPRQIDKNSVITQTQYEKIDMQKLQLDIERQIQFQKGKQLPETNQSPA